MGGSEWRNAALAALLLTLVPSPHAVAARWIAAPDITVRETYTSNASLGTGAGGSDFVTEVSPGIRLTGSGLRFKANLDYRASAIIYLRSTAEDRLANTMNASGTLEAVEKFFFVDASGLVSQNFISPLGIQPAELTAFSANRVETRSFSVSPYVRGQFRQAFSYELRNRNSWTTADNDALANAQTTQWNGRVFSPIRLFGWALEYDQSRIVYDNFTRPEQNSRLYRGRLYWQPGPELQLSASAGREENDYSLQERRYYDIYGAGLSWKPSARTSADLEWEQRFFGPSRRVRLFHRTRLTAWTLDYSRNASNFPQELLRLPPGNTAALLDAIFAARIPDPLQRQAAVAQFLRTSGTPAFLANSLAFYTQQIFLRDGLDASVAIIGARNTVTFTAFRTESTRLSDTPGSSFPDAFLLADRIRQRGFGVRFNHQLAPFTSLGASATRTFSREEEPTTRDSRNDHFSVSLDHTLSPKTTGFAGLSFTNFSSPDPAFAGNRDAKSVFVGFNHRF
jgi:uncharacterized protein (PEP-CTERM system associated)